MLIIKTTFPSRASSRISRSFGAKFLQFILSRALRRLKYKEVALREPVVTTYRWYSLCTKVEILGGPVWTNQRRSRNRVFSLTTKADYGSRQRKAVHMNTCVSVGEARIARDRHIATARHLSQYRFQRPENAQSTSSTKNLAAEVCICESFSSCNIFGARVE